MKLMGKVSSKESTNLTSSRKSRGKVSSKESTGLSSRNSCSVEEETGAEESEISGTSKGIQSKKSTGLKSSRNSIDKVTVSLKESTDLTSSQNSGSVKNETDARERGICGTSKWILNVK